MSDDNRPILKSN